jgi:nitrogen fixation NifU-like protein
MKIHCGQMVEGALKAALENESREQGAGSRDSAPPSQAGTLADALGASNKQAGKIKIILQS